MKMFSRIGRCLLVLLLVIQLGTMVYIAAFGWSNRATTADLLIVPGNTVYADGRLSARLQARLDTALSAYRQACCKLMIVSGARGREGRDEALAMRTYLIAKGVPADRVVADSLGYTSWDTALQSAIIARHYKYQSVFIVSQFFHLARLQLALEKQGLKPVARLHADYYEWRDIYSLTREAWAYWFYYFAYPSVSDGYISSSI